MKIHNYKELKVWNRGMDLCELTYSYLHSFPASESSLKNQIKRCSVSIPSNIAEGSARGSNKYFSQFLGISLGSLMELETQILLSGRLGFGDISLRDKILSEIQEIGAMIASLRSQLNQI